MMKKIRDGVGGELTAEIFETWFPDMPEVLLMDFIKTGVSDIYVRININETDVMISHITRECAQKLLDEFKIMRGQNRG